MKVIPSRGESSKKRGMNPGASWCEHDVPMLTTPIETGSYYARCLSCLVIGPEGASSEAARQALRVLGASRDSNYYEGIREA